MAKGPTLAHESDWKQRAEWCDDGYYGLETADTEGVPVRLFLTRSLLGEAEPTLYRQIVKATRFRGVKPRSEPSLEAGAEVSAAGARLLDASGAIGESIAGP
jgi:hypothetical protein